MLIDGKALAQKILEDLKKRVEKLQQEKNITPHLGIILVGTDPASESYVKQKIRMAREIHADATVYKYPEKTPQAELLNNIAFLQKNTILHGLIIQLPLPKNLEETTLLESVESSKDVDGFKIDSRFKEPIAEAVMHILEYIYMLEKGKETFLFWLQNKNVVILGKGKTGGAPIIKTLNLKGIRCSIIDSKTKNPSEIIRLADILICAVGNRGVLVHKENIKKDAILIGIGMHKGEDGKLHGDYEQNEIKDKAKYYTPIPGGVGPLNAAMLIKNVVEAAERI